MIGTLLVVLVIASGIAFAVAANTGDGLADPETVALPALDEPVPVVEYLNDFGKPIIAASSLVPAVLGSPDAKQRRSICERLVADDLPPLGTPRELFLWASGIPDPDTADIASNLVSTLITALSECLHDPTKVDLAALQFHHVVFERRLAEIGMGS